MKAELIAVLERTRRDGPVRVQVTEAEYEALRPHARYRWQDVQSSWSRRPDDQLLFLAFLRAYTFYRELSENENVFWSNFHRDLNLPDETVTNARYDNLWNVLESHPETKPLLKVTQGEHRRQRRFVDSIAAIWGIRSLNTPSLVAFFRAYYNKYPNERITPVLMRRLLPQADEATVRQASAYDHIFRHLTRVVDTLLDTDPQLALMSPDRLCPLLEASGLDLGTPNPVRFFWNKSHTALADIVGAVAHGTRRSYKIRQEHTRPRANREAAALAVVTLKPGYAMEGVPVRLSVERRFGGRRSVSFVVPGVGAFPVQDDVAVLTGLTAGRHEATLHVDGEPGGLSQPITVLPSFTVVPTHRASPLIEGQVQVGTVRLDDGRFATFRWRPEWTNEHGVWQARPQDVRVDLDAEEGLSVEFEVSARSLGARVRHDETGHLIPEVRDTAALLHGVLLALHPPDRQPPALQVRLESAPERAFPVRDGQHLTALAGLTPTAFDRILVEADVGRDTWVRVHALEYRLPARIETVKVDDAAVTAHVSGPRGLTLHVEETLPSGALTTHAQAVDRPSVRMPLRVGVPGLSRHVRLVLRDANGDVLDERACVAPPTRLKDRLPHLLRSGLGWATLRADREP